MSKVRTRRVTINKKVVTNGATGETKILNEVGKSDKSDDEEVVVIKEVTITRPKKQS